MSRIKITRLKEWYNRKFNYAIVADGKEILQLADGQAQVVELGNSKMLQAKIIWCGSNKIQLNQPLSDGAEIKVSANKLIHRFISFAPVFLLFSIVISNLFCRNRNRRIFNFHDNGNDVRLHHAADVLEKQMAVDRGNRKTIKE